MCGLLDGLEATEIPSASEAGYPLETRLRNGTRVVVDAAFLMPRLQQAVSRWDDSVRAHLVLCAGPFAGLRSAVPLVLPFEAGASQLRRRGVRSLEIAVPFRAQASPAVRKWEAAGFRCRAHDLGAKPRSVPVADWVQGCAGGADADAFVFDYVGLPSGVFDAAAAALDIPVFDLGRVATDTLAEVLGEVPGIE